MALPQILVEATRTPLPSFSLAATIDAPDLLLFLKPFDDPDDPGRNKPAIGQLGTLLCVRLVFYR